MDGVDEGAHAIRIITFGAGECGGPHRHKGDARSRKPPEVPSDASPTKWEGKTSAWFPSGLILKGRRGQLKRTSIGTKPLHGAAAPARGERVSDERRSCAVTIVEPQTCGKNPAVNLNTSSEPSQ